MTTPPSPGSGAWSPRPRRRARVRRRSPIAPRRCSSTSRPRPASSPSWCGWRSGRPTTPWSTRSRCWSSPVRTPWDWRSRWSSHCRPPCRPGPGSSSRTGSRWNACATSTRCCSTRPAPSRRANTSSWISRWCRAPSRSTSCSHVAGAVEADSEHPLARAIVTTASERGTVPRARDFRSLAGRGVEASVGDDVVAVGGPALLRERESSDAHRARRGDHALEGPRRGGALRRARE